MLTQEDYRMIKELHRRSLWLSIDSLINLLLGALLVVFPRDLSLSARGSGILWGIVAVLIVVSLAEIACVRRTLSQSKR